MAEAEGFIARLKTLGANARRELEVYRRVLTHPRTPVGPKALLALGVGYLLLPFDLIPDFIPIVGHLDDAILVPLLLFFAFKMIPPAVVEECREAAARDARAQASGSPPR